MLARSIAKAGMQSASIMTIADITTQLLVERRVFTLQKQIGKEKEDDDHEFDQATISQEIHYYDPIRTLRWTTVGLTLHGPYFFLAFGKLDRLMGTKANIITVAQKTLIAQLIVFPPYLVALFAYMGIMEQQGNATTANESKVDSITKKVQKRVPEAFMSGCIFWPIANFFNFYFVSTRMRVPYLATVGGLWNGYLSYMNNVKGE